MASEGLGGLASLSIGKEVPSDTHDKDLIEESAGWEYREVGSAYLLLICPRCKWNNFFATDPR